MSLVNPPLTAITKSIQRGVINATNSVNDVTIAAVDLSKSTVRNNGAYVINPTTNDDYSPQVRMLNSTTVRIEFGNNGAQSRNINWEVTEYV